MLIEFRRFALSLLIIDFVVKSEDEEFHRSLYIDWKVLEDEA